jgi:hypothetical protein
MPHQRIDPAHRVRRAERPVLGPQNQVETVPGVRQALFADEPANGGGKPLRRQTERVQGFLSRKVGAPARELLVQVITEGGHGPIVCETLRKCKCFAYDWGVRIIDFVDTGHPALVRMWERRRRGYQAMGYRIPVAPVGDNLNFGEAVDGRARSGLDVLTAPVAMAGRGR